MTADSLPTTPSFAVKVQSDWACAWLVARGDLDASARGDMERALDEAMKHGPRKVQLILSAITSVDATGAALLSECQERVREQGGKLVLCRPSPAVRDAARERGLAASPVNRVGDVLRYRPRREEGTPGVAF